MSYRCSLPSPLQKRSKDYKRLHRSSAGFKLLSFHWLWQEVSQRAEKLLDKVEENSEAQNLQNLPILCNPWIFSAMAMAMSIYRTLCVLVIYPCISSILWSLKSVFWTLISDIWLLIFKMLFFYFWNFSLDLISFQNSSAIALAMSILRWRPTNLQQPPGDLPWPPFNLPLTSQDHSLTSHDPPLTSQDPSLTSHDPHRLHMTSHWPPMISHEFFNFGPFFFSSKFHS